MKTILFSFIHFLILTTGFSQSVPTPGKAQTQAIFLSNATIHTGTGEVITPGGILFTNGKISAIGMDLKIPADAKVFDYSGKHIYPGLIALNTELGLVEIEAVRSTRDAAEAGNINPSARAIISYNTDSRVTPTVRSNGILIAQTVPQGGLISGRSAIVQLDAWNWEDAAIKTEDAIHVNWPDMKIRDFPKGPSAEEQKKNWEANILLLENTFQDAKTYAAAKQSGSQKATDLRIVALIPAVKKEMPVFIHADAEKELLAAIQFSQKIGIKIVLVGAKDCWRILEPLKEFQIPVVLEKIHSLPRLDDDDYDLSYKLPKILEDAGILFALAENGFWDQRNLPFLAGTAASRGLSKEKALAAITLNPAKITGIDARLGSLETGKDATLIVTSGDLFEMKESNVIRAFINGREIDLRNQQTDLFEKFGGK